MRVRCSPRGAKPIFRLCFQTALLTIAFVCCCDLARAGYIILDLGTLTQGTSSYGMNLNEVGQVVGYAQSPTGFNHAFAWNAPGDLRDLGTLKGGLTSQATAINDTGVLTGYGQVKVGSQSTLTFHAFASSGGTLSDLGTFKDGNWSKGFAINNSGVIAGAADVDGFSHAFIYSGGAFIDLHTLGGFTSQANAINNLGAVAGSSDTGLGSSHAFRTDQNGVMRDLGALTADTISDALAINDVGQIAGYSGGTNGIFHAIRSDGAGHLKDLGTLSGTGSSKARGINNHGDVVGEAGIGGGSRAFLYTDENGMIDLNQLLDPNSGWVLQGAFDINDAGMITGFGTMNLPSTSGFGSFDAEIHAFLLVPTGDPTSSGDPAVPSPSGLVLTTIGGLILGGWAWKRGRVTPQCSHPQVVAVGKGEGEREVF
jgi:probable HAF family extracellular repeat protein